jgi:hypothetical protein
MNIRKPQGKKKIIIFTIKEQERASNQTKAVNSLMPLVSENTLALRRNTGLLLDYLNSFPYFEASFFLSALRQLRKR